MYTSISVDARFPKWIDKLEKLVVNLPNLLDGILDLISTEE